MSLIALGNDPLSLVLEYLGDPEYAQLPGWEKAGELVAGRIWRQIGERPPSPVGAIANTLDTLPITTSEKLRRLVEQTHNEFAYRSQLGWATWALDKIYDPKWADQVDAHLSRLDLDEAEQVLPIMASRLWNVGPENLFRPVEQAFPPALVQSYLEKIGISNQVSVKDVHLFVEFLRGWHRELHPHNRPDMAYLKEPKTKLLISAYFRETVRGLRDLNRFPSIFIRDFNPEKLLIGGKYCPFPLRLPPNCLRVLHLCDFGHPQLPEGAFDGMNTLEELYLDKNLMTSLPRFGRLHRLTKLSAKDNGWTGIKSLPESLGDLPNLKELHLGGNNLQVVPATIFDSLPSLELIDLLDNPLNPERIDAPSRVEVRRDGFANNMPGRGTIVQTALSIKRTGESLIEHRYCTLLGLLLLALHLYCKAAYFPNTW